jgi:hypothetical protein
VPTEARGSRGDDVLVLVLAFEDLLDENQLVCQRGGRWAQGRGGRAEVEGVGGSTAFLALRSNAGDDWQRRHRR